MAEQQKQKKGKKTFYEVKAPLTSTKIMLLSSSLEELDGKIIRLDLTKNLRGKNMELKLRVKKEGEELKGIPESLELMGSYVRRAMRKGTDYVEDSFETEARDSVVLVKPLLLTRMRVPRSVLKALRNETRKQTEIYIKTHTAQELFSEIIANRFQKQLALKLKKIYPLALCEIRVFRVLKLKEEKKDVAPSIEIK